MLNVAATINRKRDAIHIASVLYYHFDCSMFSDHFFDTLSRELVTLHTENPELVHQGYEWKAFADWDGSSGYHLPLTNYALQQAELTIKKLDQTQEN